MVGYPRISSKEDHRSRADTAFGPRKYVLSSASALLTHDGSPFLLEPVTFLGGRPGAFFRALFSSDCALFALVEGVRGEGHSGSLLEASCTVTVGVATAAGAWLVEVGETAAGAWIAGVGETAAGAWIAEVGETAAGIVGSMDGGPAGTATSATALTGIKGATAGGFTVVGEGSDEGAVVTG